ncbi:hypothetical protein B0H19DRAFT_1072304 [Mycena capillaripes]|nr:hypothetical protein B0H19DRAFT_1072304 [Mycena capillaripes]
MAPLAALPPRIKVSCMLIRWTHRTASSAQAFAMPSLPIDVLENIVDSSAGYKHLLGALGLTSRTLTARTRVHLFHTIHLGTPRGPHTEKPSVRYDKVFPTRCDTFLALCGHNPDLTLHVRALVISQSVWHRMEESFWPHRSESIVPVVHSLVNLRRFAFCTEGLNVTAHLSPPLRDVLSFVLAKSDMEWIRLADIRFGPAYKLFDIFAKAARLRVLNLADIGFYLSRDNEVENISGYNPVQIDTLAVSFDVQRIMEEPLIRIALRHPFPLFDMQSIRCLQIQVYHEPEDMDRVCEWLSMACSIAELDIFIVPGNKALRLRDQRFWKHFTTDHFNRPKDLNMPHLKTISFRMRDHDGIGKIAAVVELIALAESLMHISIHFTNARGLLSTIAQEPWRRVDTAFSTSPAFPLLNSVQITFGRNSHIIPDLNKTLKAVMPNTAGILRVTETR